MRFHANELVSPGNLSNAKAAFLHPLRNRPFLSEMDPNILAREQPKLCYWNKLCPWRSSGSRNLPTRALTHTILRSRRCIRTFECRSERRNSSWPRIAAADDATRAIRFLLASGAEESAINSPHNAASRTENLRDVREQHSRATLATTDLFYDLRMAQQASIPQNRYKIGKAHSMTKESYLVFEKISSSGFF